MVIRPFLYVCMYVCLFQSGGLVKAAQSAMPERERSALHRIVADKGFAILDGGLATELERHGKDLNDPLWSAKCLIEDPAAIEAVHLDYFRAGADVAITASYQASLQGFAARGLEASSGGELLQRSVEIACRARERFLAEQPSPPSQAGGQWCR